MEIPESPNQLAPALPPSIDNSTQSSAAAAWFLSLIASTALLSFYHLEGGARFEPIDCWVAQTAREMRERGDWIVPYFAGQERMQKSPGAYWAVMLTSIIRGTPVDEVSARIPNALAAVVLVATIFWLARRIAGDRAAIFAGFTSASSLLVLQWSHRGASDLGLTTLIAVSLACVWAAVRESVRWKRRGYWLVAYFAAGLGMLYKMPMPLVCVGLPAICYVLIRRRWHVLADWWHLVGLAVFCLPWVPWAMSVYFAYPTALAKWKVEFVDRATGAMPNIEGDTQTPWQHAVYYLLPPLIFCFPFSLSLPQALVRPFRARPNEDQDGKAFLLIWFTSLLVFFTVAVGKEFRYILPAIPPLFVLLGCELSEFFDLRRTSLTPLRKFGTTAVWVLAPAALGGLAFAIYRIGRDAFSVDWPEFWWKYAVFAGIFAMGLSLSAWHYRRGCGEWSFAALVGTMWVAWFWIWPMLMPMLASQREYLDFAAQLKEKVPQADAKLMFHVGSHDPRIIWYSDFRYPRIVDQKTMLELQGGKRSREREERITAEAMIARLSADERALLVIHRFDYIQFMSRAPAELAAASPPRPMPPIHLWLQARTTVKMRQFLLISNKPPPWPEQPLTPPSDKLADAPAAHSGRPTSTPSGG